MTAARKPVFPSGYEPPGMEHGRDYITSSEARQGHWEADQYVSDGPAVECSRCQGTGLDWSRATDESAPDCPKCEGTGEEPEHEPWWAEHSTFPEGEECIRCGGTGEEPVGQVCRRCGGTGEEPPPASAPAATFQSPSTQQIPCGKCRQGQWGKPANPGCERCKGTGIAPPWKDTRTWTPWKPQTPPKPAPPKTWKDWPWTADKSRKAAKSANVFVRVAGLARDVLDGYWACPATRHWGPRGGAGIVPFTVIEGQPLVLLSHRGSFVEEPGTWSSFGGAIDREDKSPFAGAVREMFEEVDGLPAKGQVVHAIKHPCHACGWTYHTFVIRVDDDPGKLLRAKVRKGPSAWETQGVAWVPVWLVSYYDLHPGFAKSWPEVRAAIEASVK